MARQRKAELLGDIVRAHRIRSGLSQEAGAERADLHRTYVGLIEQGERRATVETMWKVAVGALDVSFIDLMDGSLRTGLAPEEFLFPRCTIPPYLQIFTDLTENPECTYDSVGHEWGTKALEIASSRDGYDATGAVSGYSAVPIKGTREMSPRSA